MNPLDKQEFVQQNDAMQQRDRQIYTDRDSRTILPIEEARENAVDIEWKAEDVAEPSFLGKKVVDDIALETLADYIDWTPFFFSWEMRYPYPDIFEHDEYGEVATELFEHAREMLDDLISSKDTRASGVYGFFPANADGDDICSTRTSHASASASGCACCASSASARSDQANMCLSDLSRRWNRAAPITWAAFAVTGGLGRRRDGRALRPRQRRLQQDHAQDPLRPARRGFRGVFARAGAPRPGATASRGLLTKNDLIDENIGASARRRAIPRAPTTPKKPSCGTCSTSKSAPASNSPSPTRCGRARPSLVGTLPTPARGTSR